MKIPGSLTSALNKKTVFATVVVVGLLSLCRTYAQWDYPQAQRVASAAQQFRQALHVKPVVAVAQRAPSTAAAMGYLDFDGRYAFAPVYMPVPVRMSVAAGNELQNKPYQRGGGHKYVNDSAYDCSGSVSYCLIKSGLLRSPLSSKEFVNYGESGPGKFITIYVKPGEHVFMSICGLRFDTSGGSKNQGPRWRAKARSMEGFVMRHPFGL
jgi:hypothetical protein